MSFSIFIDQAAEQDIAETVAWYNEQKPGLGDEYVEELQSILRRLQETPLIYRTRYRYTRIARLNRFPFHAHFYLDEKKKEVTIISVLHAGRHPQLWRDRTRDRLSRLRRKREDKQQDRDQGLER